MQPGAELSVPGDAFAPLKVRRSLRQPQERLLDRVLRAAAVPEQGAGVAEERAFVPPHEELEARRVPAAPAAEELGVAGEG